MNRERESREWTKLFDRIFTFLELEKTSIESFNGKSSKLNKLEGVAIDGKFSAKLFVLCHNFAQSISNLCNIQSARFKFLIKKFFVNCDLFLPRDPLIAEDFRHDLRNEACRCPEYACECLFLVRLDVRCHPFCCAHQWLKFGETQSQWTASYKQGSRLLDISFQHSVCHRRKLVRG